MRITKKFRSVGVKGKKAYRANTSEQVNEDKLRAADHLKVGQHQFRSLWVDAFPPTPPLVLTLSNSLVSLELCVSSTARSQTLEAAFINRACEEGKQIELHGLNTGGAAASRVIVPFSASACLWPTNINPLPYGCLQPEQVATSAESLVERQAPAAISRLGQPFTAKSGEGGIDERQTVSAAVSLAGGTRCQLASTDSTIEILSRSDGKSTTHGAPEDLAAAAAAGLMAIYGADRPGSQNVPPSVNRNADLIAEGPNSSYGSSRNVGCAHSGSFGQRPVPLYEQCAHPHIGSTFCGTGAQIGPIPLGFINQSRYVST